MRGINENLSKLRLCHQIKEESVFAGTKTSAEIGKNNVTKDKGIDCPPTTFFFVVVQLRKNMNEKQNLSLSKFGSCLTDSPYCVFSVRWPSSPSVRSASPKTWTGFTSSERLRSRPPWDTRTSSASMRVDLTFSAHKMLSHQKSSCPPKLKPRAKSL